MPLFFRSFDDYKSPLYPYVLAGVFEVTGLDARVARGLSAVLVLAAVLLLGLLARRLTQSLARRRGRPARGGPYPVALRARQDRDRGDDGADPRRAPPPPARADEAARAIRRPTASASGLWSARSRTRTRAAGCSGRSWPARSSCSAEAGVGGSSSPPGLPSSPCSSRWACTRSVTPAPHPHATRRQRSPGTGSRVRESSSRRSGTGSVTSIPGTGQRLAIRRRTSTTGATERCSLPSSHLRLRERSSSSFGGGRTSGGATCSWRPFSCRFPRR